MVTLEHGEVLAEVAPARGALVTRLRVGDREVLYLDRATLDDPSKNVRGGVPLLFPFAGKLADDTLTLTGTKMKQHGFARDRAWTVSESEPTRVRMTLRADEATQAQYPFDFVLHHEVRVVPRGLQLALTVVAGDDDLPVAPGWHPYFALAREDKLRVAGDGVTASQCYDDREFDFGLVAPLDGRSRFERPSILLEASPDMRHLHFWSLPEKPFLCIEPFYGPMGTLNTDARGWVKAGTARTFWMRMTVP